MEASALEAWLRLTLTPHIGNTTARSLLARFGLPEEFFRRSPDEFATLLTPVQRNALAAPPAHLRDLLDATQRWLEVGQGAHRVLTLGDPAYPSALLEVPDPPLMLYGIARAEFWDQARWPVRALAVVGSRNPSAQGAENAHLFASELSRQGICVVSGLALGIDGAAHAGALESPSTDLPTIAVVGTGLDRVYPARHRDLAHRIAHAGLILSEYPLGTPPLAHHFPQRNRILCGLSVGTLVVEATLQSGSLITARLCADQGKEVFAIPGSIHSPLTKGCHALIRQGAKLVECVQDILDEIPQRVEAEPIVPLSAPEATNAVVRSDACPVLDAMGFDPATLDQLQSRTGWTTPALQARLAELELQGNAVRLPGGRYQRLFIG